MLRSAARIKHDGKEKRATGQGKGTASTIRRGEAPTSALNATDVTVGMPVIIHGCKAAGYNGKVGVIKRSHSRAISGSERVPVLVEGGVGPQSFKLQTLSKLSTHVGIQAGCDPAFVYALSRSGILFARPWGANAESGESVCSNGEDKRRGKEWNGFVNEYIRASGAEDGQCYVESDPLRCWVYHWTPPTLKATAWSPFMLTCNQTLMMSTKTPHSYPHAHTPARAIKDGHRACCNGFPPRKLKMA